MDLPSNYWEMLTDRVRGPLAFRFVLQPVTVALLACRAGLRDAREGRPAYCWAVICGHVDRRESLHQAWRDISRVFLFAVAVDLIYEIIVFHRIYPGQSLIVATLLALLPYPLIRGIMNRIARRLRPSGGRDRDTRRLDKIGV